MFVLGLLVVTISTCLCFPQAPPSLSWKSSSTGVTFRLEAPPAGYVALALAPGPDALLAFFDHQRQPHLKDCYVGGEGILLEDKHQDYKLLKAYQNATHTFMEFTRPWDTCDPNDSVLKNDGSMMVRWGSDSKTPSEGGRWEGVHWKGVGALHLAAAPVPRPTIDHLNTWDITAQQLLISEQSYSFSWCKIYKVPMDTKRHIIGFEPLIQPGHEEIVRRIVLYECLGSGILEQFGSHEGATCHTPSTPTDWAACVTPVIAWALGSTGEFYPKEVGLPLAEGEGKATYFMLEIHYDNPRGRRVMDSSGLRIFHTEELRKYDGAMLVTGLAVSPLHLVPPHQSSFTSTAYCDNQCTNLMFPETGIRIVSVTFHTHSAGQQLRLRHIRDGKEIQIIAQDSKFYPEMQEPWRVSHALEKVMPGDDLVVECTYNTSTRSSITTGGYSWRQELCLAYLLYYPRVALASCTSTPPLQTFFHTLGVHEFYDHNMKEIEDIIINKSNKQLTVQSGPRTQSLLFSFSAKEGFNLEGRAPTDEWETEDELSRQLTRLVIRRPEEFLNRSLSEHLASLPWREPVFTRSLEASLRSSKHKTMCSLKNSALAMPSGVYNFPNVSILKEEEIPRLGCSDLRKREKEAVSSQFKSYSIPSLLSILVYLSVFHAFGYWYFH